MLFRSDVKFVKTADDGLQLNANDRTKIGSSLPDFTYGLNFNFGYKGFDLLVFLQGVYGVDIANAKVQQLYHSKLEGNIAKEMMNRWTPENPGNKYPRMTELNPNENQRFSDRYIENGSYLRVKNIQLGYTLPKAITQKAKLNTLRIYASVDNLHVFTKYSGFDPEIGDQGGNVLNPNIDQGTYPRPRVMTLGLNLTF